MRGFANTYRARGARRAYTHEGMAPDELPTELLLGTYQTWKQLEDEIDALQSKKKAMVEAIRSRYGRHQAEAVKVTMRLMMMDPNKRTENAMFDAMARRYVAALEGEMEGREYEH